MPGGPASRHVVCNVGGTVIVHTFRCLDSVLVWDAASETLKEQPTSGTPPSSRGLHVAAAADGHTLVAFGSALAEDADAAFLFLAAGGAAKDGQMVNDAFALDTRVVGALCRGRPVNGASSQL